MIITGVEGLRDPFILVDNGVYYLYGTGVYGGDWEHTCWDCYINDSGDLRGEWRHFDACLYKCPPKAEKQFWSPEVHKHNGFYYMLATYYSLDTGHRGCSVLKADSPTGPFVEISGGHITPKNWDAIDATLFVDGSGQPWLIFVHEWTCTEDGTGRMAAAKLSDDFRTLVSEPIELFRADAPQWTNGKVTDGCFMHTTSDGSVLMLWSNNDCDGYTVAVAHSENGSVYGKWVHEAAPIYKRGTKDKYDGGHGMIFTALDGQQYLALHSPNAPCEECKERTVFIPIIEENGTLRI